jgi:hypothetical protein
MAKKPVSSGNKKSTPARSTAPAAAPKARAAKPAVTTEVRNTAVPPRASGITAARRELTHDMIARRAYEIFASGMGGSEMDNWCRAERELRAELGL